MRFAILSDLHLGYRQYGSLEREEDFYLQYLECMRQIKKHDVDYVIIAGDIFDKPNPSPKAMDIYRKGILSLDGIPTYTITGNHTMLMRDNHYTVDNYFSESGIDEYHLIDDSIAFEDDFDITGLIYRSDNDLDVLNEVRKDLLPHQKKDKFHILVIHQALKEYCGFTGAELSINDLDYSNYDLIVCGHIHSPHTEKIDDTLFIQPGSIERMNTTEAADDIQKGKGYFIYDTRSEELEFCKVDPLREFLLGDIEFNSVEDIDNHFEQLRESLKEKTFLPIVSYNYYDNTGHTVHIREQMKNLKVLINNSNVYDLTEEVPSLEISEGELPTVIEAIDMAAPESFDEKSTKLAKEIFEAYDSNNEDKVEGIISSFFEKNYPPVEGLSEEDIQQYEKEVKEYEEFFDKLGEK